jgi:hypothetical protein
MTRVALLALLLAVSAVFLAPMAQAADATMAQGVNQIDITIQAGGWVGYVVDAGRGDVIDVELAEAHDTRIDFYLTNYSAYLVYKDAPPGVPLDFYYISGGYSGKAVPAIAYQYVAFRSEKLVIVIDNANKTEEGAESSGSVTVRGTVDVRPVSGWGLRDWAVAGACAGGMVAIIGVAMWRSGRKKRPRKAQNAAKTTGRPARVSVRKPLSPKRRFPGR